MHIKPCVVKLSVTLAPPSERSSGNKGVGGSSYTFNISVTSHLSLQVCPSIIPQPGGGVTGHQQAIDTTFDCLLDIHHWTQPALTTESSPHWTLEHVLYSKQLWNFSLLPSNENPQTAKYISTTIRLTISPYAPMAN